MRVVEIAIIGGSGFYRLLKKTERSLFVYSFDLSSVKISLGEIRERKAKTGFNRRNFKSFWKKYRKGQEINF